MHLYNLLLRNTAKARNARRPPSSSSSSSSFSRFWKIKVSWLINAASFVGGFRVGGRKGDKRWREWNIISLWVSRLPHIYSYEYRVNVWNSIERNGSRLIRKGKKSVKEESNYDSNREAWSRSLGGIFFRRGRPWFSADPKFRVWNTGSTQRCSSLTPLTRFHSRFEATATRRAAPRLASPRLVEPGFLAFYPGTNSAVSPGKILSYKSYAPFDKLPIQSTNESIDPTDSRGRSMAARLSSLYFSPFLLVHPVHRILHFVYVSPSLSLFLIFDPINKSLEEK